MARKRTPQLDRKEYEDYLQQFRKRDVPWKSDEEALAKWIVTKDPHFSEKHTPFIGYLQFLFEGSLYRNQRIAEVKIQAPHSIGGTFLLPKDGKSPQGRDIPWRFQAAKQTP